jgi:hypothetical protein
MRRKSVLLTAGTLLLVAIAVGVSLIGLLRHEPTFYRRQAVPAGRERQQRASEFKAELSQFLEGLLNQPRHGWYARFSELQINSYLAEDCEQESVLRLPDGIREPRIALEADRIRLGFRYGSGWLSSVVALDLRLWLAPREANVIAIEVCSLRRGAVPISAHPLLEHISEAARQRGLDVTWFRHDGHPVALLRLQSDQPRATMHLQRLELQPSTILISGSTPDAGQ